MCGIVGAVSTENISQLLLQGLQRLEYRGYDSAGIALLEQQQIKRVRSVGKVQALMEKCKKEQAQGRIGIAHTRWATHGEPSESNAHPHLSDPFVIVHNGIIENHQALRQRLQQQGYQFTSQTDTEVIVHLIHCESQGVTDWREAVQKVVKQLKGAYGMAVMNRLDPHRIIAARSGSPLVIGLGKNTHYLASDPLALSKETNEFIYLEEGDIAEITAENFQIFNQQGKKVSHPVHHISPTNNNADKGQYQHFMQKEIFEQPVALARTLQKSLKGEGFYLDSFSPESQQILSEVEHIQIIACGTSYHAGLVAKYWLEEKGISCDVEIASEFRYRSFVVRPKSLILTLSQSGETADTLAALRLGKEKGFMASMTICNVASSSLVRESEFTLMTEAGVEIGVASTKAFTTQLVNLMLLVGIIGRLKSTLTKEQEKVMVEALHCLPVLSEKLLSLEGGIAELSKKFAHKTNALFLGRGSLYPIAMEGALKLKEISYIHAESYAAGELKHGPLALIDEQMPVVVLAPSDTLLDKVASNVAEVQARGGEIILFTDKPESFHLTEKDHLIQLPTLPSALTPLLYSLPMQLLAYHVALVKGTDVDKPRNLAKAVTVE